jgi:hypothetical protein
MMRVSCPAIILLCIAVASAICRGADAPPPAKDATSEAVAASGSRPQSRWPAGRTIFAETALEKRIRSALAQPLTHEFKDVSLPELATFLEEKLKCAVNVDVAAFAGNDMLELDMKLSHRARGGSLQDELRRLFATASYWAAGRPAFIVRGDCLWITTPSGAELGSQLRIYQVHDLVVDPSDLTVSNPRLEELGWLIQRCCGGGWRAHGRTYADLKAFEGPGILALIVVQTEEGHEAIERLLAQLRAARIDELQDAQQAPKPELLHNEQSGVARMPPLPPAPKMPRGKAIDENQTVAERKIRELLRQPTKLSYVDKPLGEIAAELEKRFGIHVRLDTFALAADGKGEDSQFSLRWPDGELCNALAVMLEPQGLTYFVQDDSLVVTTRTASEVLSRNVVYQVHDLIPQDSGLIGQRTNFESLTEVVTGLIVPQTWDDDWHCTSFETAGVQALVIEQGERCHPQIETFLDLLRDAFEPKVYEAQRRRPIVMPPKEVPGHPGTRGTGGGF